MQAAKEAKGANARTKELTGWKRNVCNRACFVKLCLYFLLLYFTDRKPFRPIIKTSLGPAFHTPYMWLALATLQRFAIEKLKQWNSAVVVFLSSTAGVTQLLPHLGQTQEQYYGTAPTYKETTGLFRVWGVGLGLNPNRPVLVPK